MTENPNQNPESQSSAGTENTEHMIPKSRFNEVNNQLKEALSRIEAMETEAKTRQTEAEKMQQKELAEQNRYKELYEQEKARTAQMESLQSEVKRYRDSFESTLQARIQSIPEEKRALIPEYDDPIKTMAWLDKALPELTTPPKPNAPRLDGGSGGAGGSDGTSKPLNATQLQLAELARQSGFNVDVNRIAHFARNPTTQTDLDKRDSET